MIDLKDLRENPDIYRVAAARKRISADIDATLAADREAVEAQRSFEKFRAEQNEASKEIGKLKDTAAKQQAIANVASLKTRVKGAEELWKAAQAKLEPLLLQIPQPPDDDVPIGKDASDNVVVRHVGEPRVFDFKPKSHIELGRSLNLIDFDAGVKLAGARSYYMKARGAELYWAVLRFAFDMMTREKGFMPLTVPLLVRETAMRGTGFFPGGKEQTYHVDANTENELFLVGTSEVGLVAYHMDDVLEEATLPRKYTAISTCFRREAGTYGKDTAGLYRVHQFDKCEQVIICKNDVAESKRLHMEMLGYSEELLQRLGLPYRVINCCTGDIGMKNASMYDIETWMPSRSDPKVPGSGYGETHSASRLYDFQARRLNLRYKTADGKLHFCHTLNNTVAATPRILIPILENNQHADGTITVPPPLRPYMNGLDRITAEK